jgi:hypothetical protein
MVSDQTATNDLHVKVRICFLDFNVTSVILLLFGIILQ